MKVNVKCLCKDCEYSEQESVSDNGKKTYYCYFWDYETGMAPNIVEEDDFCSNAKCKESQL